MIRFSYYVITMVQDFSTEKKYLKSYSNVYLSSVALQ
jgi:hypothetical protein